MNDPAERNEETLNQDLHQAVADVLRNVGGLMANRVVVLAEVVEEDGGLVMWSGCTPGTKAWQTMGLLRYAISMEDAANVTDRRDG